MKGIIADFLKFLPDYSMEDHIRAYGCTDELREKSIPVDWDKDARKHYAIIGRKIENKEIFREEGYYVFDMEDISKMIG